MVERSAVLLVITFMPILPPEVYWKLRALSRDAEAIRREAQDRVTTAERLFTDALTAAGLTPGVAYQLKDETCEVVAPEEAHAHGER